MHYDIMSQRPNKNYLAKEKKPIKQRDMSINTPQNIVFKIQCLRKLSYNVFPVFGNSPFNYKQFAVQRRKNNLTKPKE